MPLASWIKQVPSLLKYPLRELCRNRRRRAHTALKDEVLAAQWLSQDEICSIQLARLKQLLRHAYQTTVYYRERFDQLGLRVGDIRSLSDYAACVPVLDRRPLQERLEDLISSEWQGRYEIHRTSGSTGRPTRYAHPCPNEIHPILWALVDELCELRGDERTLHLQGRRLPDGSDHQYHPETNTHRFSFYRMSPKRLEDVLDLVLQWRPELVIGYTSLIVVVAQALQERGHSGLGVKVIQTHSEKLYPPQRELVEKVYGGRAFEHYGSSEIHHFGVECTAHAGIHLFSPLRIFEIEPLNEHQTDTGELIITDLYNRAMPFLRYRIDDVVTIDRQPCACGRSLPRVEIDGRTFDLVRLRDGTILAPRFFSKMMDAQLIRHFLIHQRSYDRIDVHIVPSELFTDDCRDYIVGEIRDKLGFTDTRFFLEDKIDEKIAGKLRLIRSDVSAQIVRASRELPTQAH